MTMTHPIAACRRHAPPAIAATIAAIIVSAPPPFKNGAHADASLPGPRLIFVDANVVGGANDGSSWGNAFAGRLGLQAALAAAGAGPADIWIADGTYAPATQGGSPSATFVIQTGIAIYGGFAGGETSLDQRDPAINHAILTGDLNSNDPSTADNSTHVLTIANADASARLDGLIIEAGVADASPSPGDIGGNVMIVGGSPAIHQCTIRSGWASWGGGGVSISAASPTITHCTFISNTGQLFGGAVHHTGASEAVFEDCRFEQNIGGNGAGIFNGTFNSADVGRPVVRRCQFIANAGAIGSASGIGMFDYRGQPLIERCAFIGNHTPAGGGGMYLASSAATVRECLFVNNQGKFDGGGALYIDGGLFEGEDPPHPTIINCLMLGNNGAMACNFNAHVEVINCTIAHNSDFDFAWPTLFVADTSSAHLVNSVIWGNTPVFEPGLPGILLAMTNATIEVDHCRVQMWDGSLPGAGTSGGDPQFVDAAGVDGVPGTADDDVRVVAGSPCIDAGDNAAVPAGITVDYDGEARFTDDPQSPDGGVGQPPIVDIGAFEYQPRATPGDINGDGRVNVSDLLAVLNAWGACAPPPRSCDADIAPPPDGDGVVNAADLIFVISNWG